MALHWNSVIFDLDGTLANTVDLIIRSYNHAYESVLGEIPDETEIRPLIGRALRPALTERNPEHVDQLERVYVEWSLANLERLTTEYAGVAGLVKELAGAGARLGVVTSKRRETARRTLGAVHLEDSIEVLAGLEDTAAHKPDPAPLLLGAERIGAAPADCVYVGDAVVDIRAAQAAGMASIGVTWGAGDPEELQRAGPRALATTVCELRELLFTS